MSLETLQSIEEAINLINEKKQGLKEAFDNLHSQSPSTPLVDFTWSELDSYLTSFEEHLVRSFADLQSPALNPKSDEVAVESVPARPELKAMCEKNDGLGLRSYVLERPEERDAVVGELVDGFRHAPYPGSMVLDALDGFWEGDLDSKLRDVSVLLLEEFMRSGLGVGAECKSRALSLALEWKGKISMAAGEKCDDTDRDESGLRRLAFMYLLGAYKLMDDDGVCSRDEVIGNIVEVGKFQKAVDLCWKLGIENNVSDVVRRLVGKEEQVLAIKFIFEFKLTEEFPPVLLLKEYVISIKNKAQVIRKKGKNSPQSLKDAAAKEISALKAAIKCIDDHNLESKYPKDKLLTRLEKLEKEKAELESRLKNKAPAKKSIQNANKRMRPNPGSSVYNRKAAPPQRPSARYRPDAFPIHDTVYLGSTVGVHGPVVFEPVVGLDPYGLPRAHFGFPGDPAQSYPGLHPRQRRGQPNIFHPVYYPL